MRRGLAALLLIAPTLALAQPAGAASAPCTPDPLGGRALYLRGSFNGWAASDAQRFTWSCNRWELVTRLQGEHRFKLADEAWSADADWGATDGELLVLRGPEVRRNFAGTYRLTVNMDDKRQARLQTESCPAGEGGPPLGATTLFLRGTPNNWAALDDYAFQYSCDAYYLNVRLKGRHEFKIADAAWSPASTITADGMGQANFVRTFEGEHTLRLAWAGGRPQLDVGPLSFADPREAAVTDPVALSLRFDSRDEAHKAPFGAQPAGTEIRFVLRAAPGVEQLTLVLEKRRLQGNQEQLAYSEVARVPMHRGADAQGEPERWTAGHRFGDVAVYGYWFEARIAGRLYAYQNNADAVHWTREKGSGGLGAVAVKPPTAAALGSIRRFRQTIHAPDFRVPDWAADIVYYYIFPERFRNGDPRNDPQPGRDKYHQHTVERHPRWMGRPFKPGTGDGSDAVYNNDFFGGDLAGIIDKLDYIRELGANTIYMTPIFRAASNHKYDTADYRNVDPAFGSNADFERLTREAAKRGIRIIADTSLNHTGSDSIYFDRYHNFGGQGAFAGGRINPASPYASWYRLDTSQRNPDKQYQGWVGVADLPELDKASPAWRQFAYGAPDSVMKLWLDRGASGWRMDVAPWVSDDFWCGWRAAIKAHKPDALTVAETWFDASKYFLGDMFDSTMNYIFRNAVQAWAAGGPAFEMMAQLEHLREAYPPQAWYALMNLLSTHDQARALHHFGWHDGVTDAATIAKAKARLKLAVLFQMSYPGAPSVYYGDEVGVSGGDDPYNRAPYPWADEGGEPDTALLAEFKAMIALRHQHAVLRRGSLGAPLFVDAHAVVLVRRLGEQWAITAFHNAGQPRRLSLTLPDSAPHSGWRDARGGAAVPLAGRNLTLDLPALSGVVLVTR